MTNSSMRHRPQQARSRQTVDRILDAAADLIGELGYDSVTTNAIAERADVSIGALYRYFPDKEAILRALAERYVEQIRSLHEGLFTPDVVYLPLPVLIDRMLDPFVAFDLAHPGFKQLFLGADVSADIASAARTIEVETRERIKNLIKLGAPGISEERAYLVAVVCKAVVKALTSLILSTDDEMFQQAAVAEVKRMLIAYLAPTFEGGSHAEPA